MKHVVFPVLFSFDARPSLKAAFPVWFLPWEATLITVESTCCSGIFVVATIPDESSAYCSFTCLQIYYMTRGPQRWPSVLSVSASCQCCQAHRQRLHVFSTYILLELVDHWPCYVTNTHTDCSNAQPIMIAMSGTAATGGHRRRPGGGSMTTLCDWCSNWRFLPGSSPLQLPDCVTWEMI
jgi:hypothetical protein